MTGRNIIQTLLTAFFLILGMGSALANCVDNIIATTPDQDFTDNGDGTVTHNTTGLMWMRCSLGQEWIDSSCRGSARLYTWSHALTIAEDYIYDRYSDWRLPNRKELESILEERCYNPAINTTLFPNTPSQDYLTSSPYAVNSYYSHYISFHSGIAFNFPKSNGGRVRLVRNGL